MSHAPDNPGEFGLIAEIRRAAGGSAAVPLGIGDDCALVAATAGGVLVTTDLLLEGRHFLLGETTPAQVGYKALAVNLSDIAAMAGRPRAAFIAVGLPKGRAPAIARGLLAGMLPLAERFGVVLAGGDTNAWDGPLVVGVTLVGVPVPPGAVRRDGARVGDVVYVTGPLGGSLLGRHLRPEPRVEEALALHAAVALHAMIDLSDGLSSDLAHILQESGGLGATLDADAIPVHADAAARAARSGRAPLSHALDDGEDFELCFTVAADAARKLDAAPPPGVALHRIGVIEARPGLRLREGDGVRSIGRGGFDHFRGGDPT
jgi:thiamine-monophosphate kinase